MDELYFYNFFEDLIYDVTEDFRTNLGKQYDINKTLDNLMDDDDLWQAMTDAIWNNLVEKEDEE